MNRNKTRGAATKPASNGRFAKASKTAGRQTTDIGRYRRAKGSAKTADNRQKKENMKNSQQKSLSQQNAERNGVFRYGHPKGKLKVMFLGGVGEIGKNMTVFEYGDSIVVIDAGMSFPGNDMPGVDVVIPDFSYLVQNRNKIKAVLLTHGHEDHIGAIAFLVERLGGKLDLYGT